MLREYLKSIADAIRSKLGTTDKINAQNFADKVSEVYEKGHDEGFAVWENAIRNSRSFDYFFQQNNRIELLELWKEDYTSKGASFQRMFFNNTKVTVIPPMDTRYGAVFYHMFSNCPNLTTVSKVCIQGDGMADGNIFNNCTALTHIGFDGWIMWEISFQWCPLSVECMKDIILNHLYPNLADPDEISGGEGWYFTVSFNDDCWNRLEADSTAPDGSTWRQYVQNVLGWNI